MWGLCTAVQLPIMFGNLLVHETTTDWKREMGKKEISFKIQKHSTMLIITKMERRCTITKTVMKEMFTKIHRPKITLNELESSMADWCPLDHCKPYTEMSYMEK